jgi:hypothetical protein
MQLTPDKSDISFLNFTSSNSTQPHIDQTNQISPPSTSSQVTKPHKSITMSSGTPAKRAKRRLQRKERRREAAREAERRKTSGESMPDSPAETIFDNYGGWRDFLLPRWTKNDRRKYRKAKQKQRKYGACPMHNEDDGWKWVNGMIQKTQEAGIREGTVYAFNAKDWEPPCICRRNFVARLRGALRRARQI